MLSGIILAGGGNTRMNGVKKALLPFNGDLMIERQIQAMQRICSEMMVVVSEPKQFVEYLDRDIRLISDRIPGQGPFGGMYSALSLCEEQFAWVVGCDQPFISQDVAAGLLKIARDEEANAVIPRSGGEYRFLNAVYHKRSLTEVRSMIGLNSNEVIEKMYDYRWKVATDENLQLDPALPFFAEEFNTFDEYKRLLML